MRDSIQTEEAYEAAMREIERLFEITEERMTPEERERLSYLAGMAEAWEKKHYPMPFELEGNREQEKETQESLGSAQLHYHGGVPVQQGNGRASEQEAPQPKEQPDPALDEGE